jgi:hypothetical protein
MAFSVTICLTTPTTDADNFSIYHTSAVAGNLLHSGITKTSLANYVVTGIPDGTTELIVKSMNDCPCSVSIELQPVTPTPTPTVTPTATPGVTITPTITPSVTPTRTPGATVTPTLTPTPPTTATFNWSYTESNGANGEMVLYINGSVVENRFGTSSGTYNVSVGDTINCEVITNGCLSPNVKANSYCTGIIADAACADGSSSIFTSVYTVTEANLGNVITLAMTSTCDSGCA